ncbi:MAG: hypothetical protein ACK5KR_02845 [Breznakia sp.]
MKLNIKNNKFKVFAVTTLVAIMAIPTIVMAMPANTKADNVEKNAEPAYSVSVVPIHEISRNDGGGGYGTHTKPSYVEDGVQYYRDGDIIQLDFKLPAGHGSVGVHDTVEYDQDKLTLISPFTDIMASMGKNYTGPAKWISFVNNWNGIANQFFISGTSTDYSVYPADYEGGSFGRAYFRVNAGVESEEGTAITFKFPAFQSIATPDQEELVYTHEGYDKDRHKETVHVESNPVTVYAKTPTEAATAPTLDLTASEATIYEGDLFDPTSYIKAVSSDSDASIGKDSVEISEGTGTFTKHQPTAGKYTFKYTVTDKDGLETVKTLDLTVAARTYTVSSVDVDSKKISLPVGTPSSELEAKIDALKAEDFSVTVACNDGTTFVAPGKVISGKTETYRVDENDNLLEQSFNVNLTLALPMVSYDNNGERVVNPYNGNPAFVSNVGDGQTDVKVAVVIGSGIPGDGGTGGDIEELPSTPVDGDGVGTGDTTNVEYLYVIAFLSLLAAGFVVRTRVKKQK